MSLMDFNYSGERVPYWRGGSPLHPGAEIAHAIRKQVEEEMELFRNILDAKIAREASPAITNKRPDSRIDEMSFAPVDIPAEDQRVNVEVVSLHPSSHAMGQVWQCSDQTWAIAINQPLQVLYGFTDKTAACDALISIYESHSKLQKQIYRVLDS